MYGRQISGMIFENSEYSILSLSFTGLSNNPYIIAVTGFLGLSNLIITKIFFIVVLIYIYNNIFI
ncbi:MAG: hypothetical protein AMS27_11415 [Bacteroides sp. SM23_62_1]|nr:MAG: hypothetical protein AMS27_11415 [Bacteroides sp. SM23_62_1]